MNKFCRFARGNATPVILVEKKKTKKNLEIIRNGLLRFEIIRVELAIPGTMLELFKSLGVRAQIGPLLARIQEVRISQLHL